MSRPNSQDDKNPTNTENGSSSDEELPTAVIPFHGNSVPSSSSANNRQNNNRNNSRRNAGFEAIAQVERQIQEMNQILGIDAAAAATETNPEALVTSSTSSQNSATP